MSNSTSMDISLMESDKVSKGVSEHQGRTKSSKETSSKKKVSTPTKPPKTTGKKRKLKETTPKKSPTTKKTKTTNDITTYFSPSKSKSNSNNNNNADPEDISHYRTIKIEEKLLQMNQQIEKRNLCLKELQFLQKSGNLIDFNPASFSISPSLSASFSALPTVTSPSQDTPKSILSASSPAIPTLSVSKTHSLKSTKAATNLASSTTTPPTSPTKQPISPTKLPSSHSPKYTKSSKKSKAKANSNSSATLQSTVHIHPSKPTTIIMPTTQHSEASTSEVAVSPNQETTRGNTPSSSPSIRKSFESNGENEYTSPNYNNTSEEEKGSPNYVKNKYNLSITSKTSLSSVQSNPSNLIVVKQEECDNEEEEEGEEVTSKAEGEVESDMQIDDEEMNKEEKEENKMEEDEETTNRVDSHISSSHFEVEEKPEVPLVVKYIPQEISDSDRILRKTLYVQKLNRRIDQLKKNNLWSIDRMSRIIDPPRNLSHWDLLLDEMIWMANDFKYERKRNVSVSSKIASICHFANSYSQTPALHTIPSQKNQFYYYNQTLKNGASSNAFSLSPSPIFPPFLQDFYSSFENNNNNCNNDTTIDDGMFSALLKQLVELHPSQCTTTHQLISLLNKSTPSFNDRINDQIAKVFDLSSIKDSSNAFDNSNSISSFNSMHRFQKQAFEWILSTYSLHSSCVLADAEGLGKTFVAISFLSYLAFEKSEWGPYLIVASPTKVVDWTRQIDHFFPQFQVLVLANIPSNSEDFMRFLRSPFHVLIVTYPAFSQLLLYSKSNSDNIIKVKTEGEQSQRMMNNNNNNNNKHCTILTKPWKYVIFDDFMENIKNYNVSWEELSEFNDIPKLLITSTPILEEMNVIEAWFLTSLLLSSTHLLNFLHFVNKYHAVKNILMSNNNNNNNTTNEEENTTTITTSNSDKIISLFMNSATSVKYVNNSNNINNNNANDLHPIVNEIKDKVITLLKIFTLERCYEDVKNEFFSRSEFSISCPFSFEQSKLLQTSISRFLSQINDVSSSLQYDNENHLKEIVNLVYEFERIGDRVDYSPTINSPIFIGPITLKVGELLYDYHSTPRSHSFSDCLNTKYLMQITDLTNSYCAKNVTETPKDSFSSPDQINSTPKTSEYPADLLHVDNHLKNRFLSLQSEGVKWNMNASSHNNNDSEISISSSSLLEEAVIVSPTEKINGWDDIYHIFEKKIYLNTIIAATIRSRIESVIHDSAYPKSMGQFSSTLLNMVKTYQERINDFLSTFAKFLLYLPVIYAEQIRLVEKETNGFFVSNCEPKQLKHRSTSIYSQKSSIFNYDSPTILFKNTQSEFELKELRTIVRLPFIYPHINVKHKPRNRFAIETGKLSILSQLLSNLISPSSPQRSSTGIILIGASKSIVNYLYLFLSYSSFRFIHFSYELFLKKHHKKLNRITNDIILEKINKTINDFNDDNSQSPIYLLNAEEIDYYIANQNTFKSNNIIIYNPTGFTSKVENCVQQFCSILNQYQSVNIYNLTTEVPKQQFITILEQPSLLQSNINSTLHTEFESNIVNNTKQKINILKDFLTDKINNIKNRCQPLDIEEINQNFSNLLNFGNRYHFKDSSKLRTHSYLKIMNNKFNRTMSDQHRIIEETTQSLKKFLLKTQQNEGTVSVNDSNDANDAINNVNDSTIRCNDISGNPPEDSASSMDVECIANNNNSQNKFDLTNSEDYDENILFNSPYDQDYKVDISNFQLPVFEYFSTSLDEYRLFVEEEMILYGPPSNDDIDSNTNFYHPMDFDELLPKKQSVYEDYVFSPVIEAPSSKSKDTSYNTTPAPHYKSKVIAKSSEKYSKLNSEKTKKMDKNSGEKINPKFTSPISPPSTHNSSSSSNNSQSSSSSSSKGGVEKGKKVMKTQNTDKTKDRHVKKTDKHDHTLSSDQSANGILSSSPIFTPPISPASGNSTSSSTTSSTIKRSGKGYPKVDSKNEQNGPFAALYSRKNNRLLNRNKPPSKSNSEDLPENSDWTLEEDSTVNTTIELYGHNWDLLCDILNSFPFSKQRFRSRQQCFDHFQSTIIKKTKSPSSSSSSSPSSTSISQSPPSPKSDQPSTPSSPKLGATMHFYVLDFLKELTKKKNSLSRSSSSAAVTVTPAPPTPMVSTGAHSITPSVSPSVVSSGIPVMTALTASSLSSLSSSILQSNSATNSSSSSSSSPSSLQSPTSDLKSPPVTAATTNTNNNNNNNSTTSSTTNNNSSNNSNNNSAATSNSNSVTSNTANSTGSGNTMSTHPSHAQAIISAGISSTSKSPLELVAKAMVPPTSTSPPAAPPRCNITLNNSENIFLMLSSTSNQGSSLSSSSSNNNSNSSHQTYNTSVLTSMMGGNSSSSSSFSGHSVDNNQMLMGSSSSRLIPSSRNTRVNAKGSSSSIVLNSTSGQRRNLQQINQVVGGVNVSSSIARNNSSSLSQRVNIPSSDLRRDSPLSAPSVSHTPLNMSHSHSPLTSHNSVQFLLQNRNANANTSTASIHSQSIRVPISNPSPISLPSNLNLNSNLSTSSNSNPTTTNNTGTATSASTSATSSKTE